MKSYFSLIPLSWLLLSNAHAQQTSPVPAAQPMQEEATAAPPPALINLDDEAAGRFCRNIETQAEAARFEMQMQRLDVKKQEINERIEILEQKRAEYEHWLQKRDDFLRQTQNSFIAIMAKMKPAAAAEQLALSDDMVAASILLKLKAAQASAIMNELPAEKAANLTHILASAQKVPHQDATHQTAQKTAP